MLFHVWSLTDEEDKLSSYSWWSTGSRFSFSHFPWRSPSSSSIAKCVSTYISWNWKQICSCCLL